jgi:Smr domain
MAFDIGSKVRLRFTGEVAKITKALGNGMLELQLDNDPSFRLPAHMDDLIPLQEGFTAPAHIQAQKVTTPVPPKRRSIPLGKNAPHPRGLLLCFEPMLGSDEAISRYKVWLLNDSPFEFVFEFDLFTGARDVIVLDELINANTILELGDFLSDDLNDSPEMEIGVQRITTAGADESWLERKMRLKAKQFFNAMQHTPGLGQMTHQFLLFEKFEQEAPKDELQGIKAYAKASANKPKPANNSNSVPYKTFNLEEIANFVPEIDLHIHALMPGYARLDKSEILRIQLKHFQGFIDKAIRLGIPRVHVIHGLGEGKLRDAIAMQLRDHPRVAKFKNEYHHKYGHGATEVIFE